MKRYEIYILGLSCIFFSKLAFSASIGLNYESNDEKYVLKKECISVMRMNHETFDSKEHYSLSIRLKNNNDCSNKFNNLINKNIGSHLRTYFNSTLLINSYIAGELKTEKGFRMPLENKALGEEIISFYDGKN
ncbi:hypothetical protein JZ09_22845 [Salmonella enterica]|nr:hypothetical protein [Salmonella enterica]EBV6530938.1 hypothetical protein [Salmonella enterica subsp. enterica serovar Oranienburg]EED3792122.1 hypothetical protein [Salmonella enterica subsp. enterica serovar Oranienburg]EGI0918549.1 hypothetical protein [Salmonella enterica]EGK8384636.1 hypothetical protein [Salmonella enterica]